MSKEFCRICDKRSKCVKICQELEIALRKDVEIENKELLLSDDYIAEEFDESYSLKNLSTPKLKNVIIKMYFIERKTPAYIVKKLRCSRQFVHTIIDKRKEHLTP